MPKHPRVAVWDAETIDVICRCEAPGNSAHVDEFLDIINEIMQELYVLFPITYHIPSQ